MRSATDAAVNHKSDKIIEPSTYRPDIDGLRALAVVSVVAYHVNPAWLPGGFVGVDIFFVISGYVVTSSLSGREKDGLSWDIFISFYGRRLKRLLPASLAMVCLASLCMTILMSPAYQYIEMYYQSGMFGLVGLSNIFYSTLKVDYFDSKKDGGQDMNPFLHTWSLGVEEQFYLITPLLSLLSSCVSSKVGNPQFISMVVLSIVALCSIALSWWLSFTAQMQAFYLLPTRFWELAAGVLLFKFEALRSNTLDDAFTQSAASLQVVTVLLLGAALYLTPNSAGFPFPFALPAVCGAVCFITSGKKGYLNKILSQSFVVLVGKASYSIYLFHWPCLVFFKWTVGLESWGMMTACLLSFSLLATLSYTCIEKPIRHWRPTKHTTVFAVFLAAILLSEMWLQLLQSSGESIYPTPPFAPQPSTLSVSHHIHVPGTCGAKQPLYGCRTTVPTLYTACGAQNETDATMRDLSECLPQVSRSQEDDFNLKAAECNILTDDRDVNSIKFQNVGRCLGASATRSKSAIFLIGDSHAAHHSFGFTNVFSQHFLVRYYVASGFGYRPSSKDPVDQLYASKVDHMLMDMLRPGDIVVHAKMAHRKPGSLEHDVLSLDRLVSASGAALLLLGDIPENANNGCIWDCTPTWLNLSAPLICERSLSDVRKALEPDNQVYSNLAKKSNGTYFFDPSYLFCDSMTCGAFIPGTTLGAKWDSGHMTLGASVYLAHFIADFLNEQNLLNLPEQPTGNIEAAAALQVSVAHAPKNHMRLRRFKGSHLLQTAWSEETCSLALATMTAYNSTSR